MLRRNAWIAKVDRAHLSARFLAERPHHGHAPVARRNRQIGHFSFKLRARIRSDALQRGSEERRLEPPQLIVAQPLFLEGEPERFGERKHLVIVPSVGPEKCPDDWLARLVVHAGGGH